MKKTTDMNGVEIKEGMTVNKHSIIGDDSSSFKTGTVGHIAAMYIGGEEMIWAGSGGAHSPKACVVIETKEIK